MVAALTAQNTQAVTGVHGVPPPFVRLQLDTLFADVRIDAAKIGMLGTADIAIAVAEGLSGPISAGACHIWSSTRSWSPRAVTRCSAARRSRR